ncbi:BTAD domain-containing putative transcriptional regulator [Streptomyces sp. NPDC056144]|uniref:AfsR/SARP family transcriptional regulator n=1 Tax=unclassified Streptomyces TaxID=2593676 RepID=UPI0035D5CAFA
MTVDEGWDLHVLGGLDVRYAGRSLPVGGARQRAVLATLLMSQGRTVPLAMLVDAVWEGREPASAVNTLQTYVSRLRAVFAAPVQTAAPAVQTAAPAVAPAAGPRIRGVPGGYRLEVQPDQVDARRFERLLAAGGHELAAGRAQSAHEQLTTGLALWQGPAYGDLNTLAAVQAEACRLEDLRVRAVELLAEANLTLGRPEAAIAGLQGLALAYPLREGVLARLMSVLHQAGRRADALATYRDARQRMVHELGVEPGAELSGVHQRILLGS